MKQLMIALVGLGLTIAVSAQPKLRGNVGSYGRGAVVAAPRVTVVAPMYRMAPAFGYGMGFGYGYSPFMNRGFGFDPFGFPDYGRRNNFNALPSELQLQIDEINNEYDFRIASLKDDDSIVRKERRQQVRELKRDKEEAIIKAKRNYLRR